MSDYRLSAKVISRGKGQSAVAAAAYRAGARLHDHRTGQTADYSRKAGVLHAEILTPEATPDWMADRAQLWNAVEAAERRKDAQLARELQLSLPHELTAEQRHELVMGFVREQFVDLGMIADVAIHAPSRSGDERNHHAHVMLSMRELTGVGFGKKARDWNSPEHLNAWREQWAYHQNRVLERYGHAARVDHRSYEAQGIDRAPTQHLGSVANDMERKGKRSRIGDENRAAQQANSARARDHAEAIALAHRIEREKAGLDRWADQKRVELDAAQDLSRLDLAQKHDRQKAALERDLEDRHGMAKRTIGAELDAIDRRLEARGVARLWRTVMGRNRADVADRKALTQTLADIAQREAEERQALERRQEADRQRDALRMARNQDRLERGIETARERRETEGWTPRRPLDRKAPEKSPQRPAESANDNRPAPPTGPSPERPPEPPQPQRDMAAEKTTLDSILDQFREESRMPWDSELSRDDGRDPWESDLGREQGDDGAGRERSPKGRDGPSR